jgi:hypothetical protein
MLWLRPIPTKLSQSGFCNSGVINFMRSLVLKTRWIRLVEYEWLKAVVPPALVRLRQPVPSTTVLG